MHWEISRCFGFIRIFVSMDNGEIIIYRTADGETRLEVRMERLFDRQYILTEDVEVEVRYRTETRTDSEGNEYEVEVPYNYYILSLIHI